MAPHDVATPRIVELNIRGSKLNRVPGRYKTLGDGRQSFLAPSFQRKQGPGGQTMILFLAVAFLYPSSVLYNLRLRSVSRPCSACRLRSVVQPAPLHTPGPGFWPHSYLPR